jgi:hypothetical protein
MAAQDHAREDHMVALFNLERPENHKRHGTDAVLRLDDRLLEFELKSATTAGGSLTTVRDFGPDHIAKWKDKHWLIAIYKGNDILHCKYGSPTAMAPWIEEKWNYIAADFNLAKSVPDRIDLETMHTIVGDKQLYTLEDAKKLQKNQYSKAKYIEMMDVFEERSGRKKGVGYSPGKMLEITRDRARYVIERGSTLNNPHIPATYFADWEQITRNHASRLRELVNEWILASSPEANVPPPKQHGRP